LQQKKPAICAAEAGLRPMTSGRTGVFWLGIDVLRQRPTARLARSAKEQALLLARTKIDTSPIHGIGCFARDPIRSGTLVWKHHHIVDIAFSAEQIRAMPPVFQAFLTQYASKEFGEDRYTLCADNARFINHSDTPNLTHAADTIVANRDIAADEELTLDYRRVDNPYEPGNVLTEISRKNGDYDELYKILGNATFARR
jgi:uncharacterized protein